MKKIILFLLITLLICTLPTAAEVLDKDWQEILKDGKGKTVNFYMFGGDRRTNNWIDTFVAKNLKEKYDIHLHRVPMGPDDYLNKLIGEKQIGRNQGSIDLLWINGENFKIAKEKGLLFGPFAEKLPNFNQYIDQDAPAVTHDFGYPTDGYEVPYGKAQFAFIYNSAKTKAPKNFAELTAWIKENPGKFTYAALPDFTSSAFVRHVIYNTSGGYKKFYDLDKEQFIKEIEPAVEYLKEIEPYLWREGESYPSTQAQLDNLYADGEVWMTMGYQPTKAAGEIAKGNFPPSSRTFVIDEGTITNTHFLAIPFNAVHKETALLTANFLLSFEAQYDKMIPANWGDFTVLDRDKLTKKQRKKLDEIDLGKATLPLKELEAHRVPEIPAKWIPIIEEIWYEEIAR